jgi:hypothetical protein
MNAILSKGQRIVQAKQAAKAAYQVNPFGAIWYVDSVTGANSNNGSRGLTADKPLADVAYCLANLAVAGDTIIMAPGHQEAFSADFTISLASVRIVGAGKGTQRALWTATGTATQVIVSGAGTMLENFQYTTATDELVQAFQITGAGSGIDGVDLVEAASKQVIQFCQLNAADTFMRNCRVVQAAVAAANSLVVEIKAANRAIVENNLIDVVQTNSASSSLIASSATASTNIVIRNNVLRSPTGTSVIALNLVANTTGVVRENTVFSAATNIVDSIALASCIGFQNFAAHVVNKSGILTPVADA